MYLILTLTKLTQIPIPKYLEFFFQLPDDACEK